MNVEGTKYMFICRHQGANQNRNTETAV